MTTKIIRIYLHFSFLTQLAHSFFFATYQIFLVGHGLSLMQINLINFFYMSSCFLLQVPTGAFADIFGRRPSVILGCFITALSFLIYYFSDGFAAFAAAEIIGALGMTFISGAIDAWVVDSLEFYGYDGTIEKINERKGGYITVGGIIGSLTGALAGNYDIALPWLLTTIGMTLVGGYAVWKLKESYREGGARKDPFAKMRKTAAEGMKYGLRRKSILYAISFGTLMTLCFQGPNMQWPLVFQSYGLSVAELGLLYNAISILVFAGNKLSGKITKLFPREKDALILGQIITVIGLLIASAMLGLGPTLIGFLVHEMGRGTFPPLEQGYLNRRLESDKRATVLSFGSMIKQLGSAVGLLLSGYLANSFSIGVSWLVSGIILGAGIIIFWQLKTKDNY